MHDPAAPRRFPTHCVVLHLAGSLSLAPGCGTEAPGAGDAPTGSTGSTASTGSTDAAGDTSTTEPHASTADAASGGAGTTGGGGSADPDTAATDPSTTASETGGESSSGSPAPVCGDGVIDGDEECDDANDVDADGCLGNCTREWFVFITSEPFTTQGNLGGVIGADYECRHRATKLFLPNGERYMAWISTSDVQPLDRLHHARGPYKRIDGVRVAADWDALVSGTLETTISVSELGEHVNALVFTGTRPDGTRVQDSTHCDDWIDGAGDNFGWYGATEAADGDWTLAAEQICGVFAGVYCFEQP